MTDDRNGGNVPPAPIPAAPPPLAAAPPPAAPVAPQPAPPQSQPAAPQPQPPYYPPPPKSKTGLWVFFLFVAFAAGAGGAILTLWLTGELWNSRSTVQPSSYGSPATGGVTGADTGMTPPAPSPAPAPAPAPTGGAVPTADTLAGSWGPNCPGSNSDAITFYQDGTAESDGESGSWSLNGNYVTLNNGRQNMTLYWEMVGNDSARVRRSGDSRTETVNRCL
ncbi:MAG TPA: hypothetical protein VMG08_14080 [Allosphingosinicella sp.]|nr:hypothetical protein [Allosphingosinicella sp.]